MVPGQPGSQHLDLRRLAGEGWQPAAEMLSLRPGESAVVRQQL